MFIELLQFSLTSDSNWKIPYQLQYLLHCPRVGPMFWYMGPNWRRTSPVPFILILMASAGIELMTLVPWATLQPNCSVSDIWFNHIPGKQLLAVLKWTSLLLFHCFYTYFPNLHFAAKPKRNLESFTFHQTLLNMNKNTFCCYSLWSWRELISTGNLFCSGKKWMNRTAP